MSKERLEIANKTQNFSSTVMNGLRQYHSKFLHDFIESSKLFPTHSFSIVPSIVFMVAIFVLLYVHFNKHINEFTRWKTRLFKDGLFHWSYFCSLRLWFAFIRLCKWIIQQSDKAMEKNSNGTELFYNKLVTHFCIFTTALMISLIPCGIAYIQYIHSNEIPNFLMWVAEDPWVGSEMGPAGHYLERPPRSDIYVRNKKDISYRSGRSSSVDTNVYLMERPSILLRPCKSAMNLKKSLDEVVGQ
ncbi:hypothetical protein ABEB36_000728 [Hypothenemus hampei]|uniref:Uncharacterized protein n=1 Tax=Hypothenemus hampei TaxID=57062 RepID=A0ABD1FCB2_HYPHA